MKSGFKRTLFHKWFYNRLNGCFQHIAHYNREGFYGVWFETRQKQADFIKKALRSPCHGQPECTFCDAERIIQSWIDEKSIWHRLEGEALEQVEVEERAELARLKEKYE